MSVTGLALSFVAQRTRNTWPGISATPSIHCRFVKRAWLMSRLPSGSRPSVYQSCRYRPSYPKSARVYTCWQPGGQMNMTESGLLVVGTMIVVIPIIVGVTFFFRHHRSEMVSIQVAEAEFQRLRARFGDQLPLLDMRERRPITDVRASQASARLRSFHTVIFDTRGARRIVRITVPYWFGRLFGRGAAWRINVSR